MVLPVTNQWQYLPTQVPLLDNISKYVTYHEGTLPLILAAPHGGRLFPTSIPDRTAGNGTVTVTDAYTKDVVLGIAKKIRERTGKSPHVVLLQLARTKVDVNREESEATDSDAGRMVWQEYHNTIQYAIHKVNQNHDAGLFIDIHGHGHPENWIELGYLLDNQTLQLSDEELNHGKAKSEASIQNLAKRYPDIMFSSFLRGNSSLGTRLASTHHLRTTPSKQEPNPSQIKKYFSGGYCTQAYSSSGDFDAIQIELPKPLRFSASGRDQVTTALCESLAWMLQTFYHVDMRAKM
ncbi:hypothetical protein BC943DRAFT_359489 [Umbelopsis sp. AD052]|nr:hypothetical protein BC943DRAFT_359489 [Umbelopsis sp. AD052]